MEELKKTLKEMGYTVKPGIGSEYEIFASDEDGNKIACVLVGNELTTSSNYDVENEEYAEYFTVDKNDKDAVIIAIEYAMCKERSFKSKI